MKLWGKLTVIFLKIDLKNFSGKFEFRLKFQSEEFHNFLQKFCSCIHLTLRNKVKSLMINSKSSTKLAFLQSFIN